MNNKWRPLMALLITCWPGIIIAQSDLCDLLKKEAVTLYGGDNVSEYHFLDSTLIGVEFLALGESSHGTQEFFTTKAAIIKYCITKRNFKHIGIEADVAGTMFANQYIHTGEGKVTEATYRMGISAWMTQEMEALLDWLKQYNKDKAPEDKINLFGFDRQFVATALADLKEVLDSLHYSGSEKWLKTSVMRMNKEELDMAGQELKQFAQGLLAKEQKRILTLYESVRVAAVYLSIKEPYQKANYRDEAMYKYIRQYKEECGEKIILWAHNEHITNKGNTPTWITMGERLHKEYGKTYYSVGLMTLNGSIGFYNRATQKGDSVNIPIHSKQTYESFFASCGIPFFYLDLRQFDMVKKESKSQAIRTNLITTIDLIYDTKKQRYVATNNFFKNDLLKKFDAVVFIKTTTASRH